jgi:hypothetical protein
LLEYGGEYFNLKTFTEGEAKTALLRVVNKRMGKRFDGDSGIVEKPRKKKKKTETPGPASGLATSGLATSGPAASGQATSGQATSGQEPTSGPAPGREPDSGPRLHQ